jgi:hypothetical protein
MFDPNLPQENTPADAVQMRNQLNGLKAIIDAILTVTAAQVDSTTTLPQGSPANASVNVVGNTLHFSFEIPQGQEGLPGLVGPAGPPFSSAVVDSVNTVEPGIPAAVNVSFDGANVRFTFDIPRGNDGMNGSNGSDGSQGPQGNDGGQGPQGNDGAQGPPFAQAVVDGVTTLDPGQPATVGVSFDGIKRALSIRHPTRQRWQQWKRRLPRPARRNQPSPSSTTPSAAPATTRTV